MGRKVVDGSGVLFGGGFSKVGLSEENLLKIYRTMLTIRSFEEKMGELFAAGEIPGFIHLCTGQESTAAGVGANLRQDDYVVSNHRGHGHCLAKGADVKLMAAEIFGRKTGYCSGKGGSMHVSAAEYGILGANGIVGGGLPIAVGAAYTALYRGSGQVAVCFFGEGATGEGTFHEAMNMASLWKLPIVFLCENNGWAEFTPQSKHMNIVDVSQRALAYGMEASTVDGTDVIAVCHAAEEAVGRARSGLGPTLLECKTYRFRGHYEGDPQRYRPKEDLEEAMRNDPIIKFETRIFSMGVLNDETAEKIKDEVKTEIEHAVRFARESDWPLPDDALSGVYA